MKTIIVTTFNFTDSTGIIDAGTGQYVTEIDMPTSPAGLTGIMVPIGGLSTPIPIGTCYWNDGIQSFTVQCTMKADKYLKEAIEKDPRWVPFTEYTSRMKTPGTSS